MTATIVNRRPGFRPVRLIDPAPFGYIHLGATVEPPAGRAPLPGRGPDKTALLNRLKDHARQLEHLDDVVKATVYRAVILAPPSGDTDRTIPRVPLDDVVVLIETTSPDTIATVRGTDAYQRLHETLRDGSRDLHIMTARCVKRIADVDKTRPGLYLFNYFSADDVGQALHMWDYLAGWYATRTHLHNSTVLLPTGENPDFAFVNHARWDFGLPRVLLHQMTKPSFRHYILANLRANQATSMPILYKLA